MIFRLAIAALLLFGQQMAIAHQAWHALDRGSARTQQYGIDGNDQSNLCAFHADFESILSAVKSTPPVLLPGITVFEQFSASLPHHHSAKLIVPASRGPPLL